MNRTRMMLMGLLAAAGTAAEGLHVEVILPDYAAEVKAFRPDPPAWNRDLPHVALDNVIWRGCANAFGPLRIKLAQAFTRGSLPRRWKEEG